MKHIIYSEEEGGRLKHYASGSGEEMAAKFQQIVKDKRFEFKAGDKLIRVIPTYIAIVEDVDDYDFVLDHSRINPPKEEEEGNEIA